MWCQAVIHCDRFAGRSTLTGEQGNRQPASRGLITSRYFIVWNFDASPARTMLLIALAAQESDSQAALVFLVPLPFANVSFMADRTPGIRPRIIGRRRARKPCLR